MYQWVATESLSGAIIADLPDLSVPSVKQIIGQYQSTTGTLPLSSTPPNWVRATLPYGAVLNLVDVDAETCLWGGLVTARTRSAADTVDLSLSTVEAYMDRRYVGDHTYTQIGQNQIVADLVNRYVKTGSNGGIPIRVAKLGGDGTLRDRAYQDQSDKSIYSVLTELSGVDGGPEWTIGWEWLHGPERITPILYVGSRVGNPVPAGLAPSAVFDLPGSASDAQLVEDFTAAKAGNDFLATSTADGDTRPQSQHVVVADPDRPTLEFRWSPSTSITNTDTLNAHAKAKAALLGQGTNTLSLSAPLKVAPQLGVDWSIGDDIGYVVGGRVPDPSIRIDNDVFVDTFTDRFGASGPVLVHPEGIESVPAFPGGAVGIVRASGWQIDFADNGVDMLTPIIISNGDDE